MMRKIYGVTVGTGMSPQAIIEKADVDNLVKMGLAECETEWTEEEKASAIETLGGLQKVTEVLPLQDRLYGVKKDGKDTTLFVLDSDTISEYTVPIRNGFGQFSVGIPMNDLDVANKMYVDNLVGDIESLLGGI